MPLPSFGMAVLSDPECRKLLATERVGRVIASVGALPTAFPVPYRLAGEDIVFRWEAGSHLDDSLDGTVLGFEVDGTGTAEGEHWVVLAVGTSHVVTEPADVATLAGLGLPRAPTGSAEQFVKISVQRVSGRRSDSAAPSQD